MTDEQLERRLRDWYRLEILRTEQAPTDLRTSVAAIPQVSLLPRHRFPSIGVRSPCSSPPFSSARSSGPPSSVRGS